MGFDRIRDWRERLREKIGWKIIDRYLLRKMLGTVVFAITLLMTIVIVFDMSENIQRFMSHNVPAKEVITGYYLNFIPYFINLFIPLFTFISVIWFTSKLSSRNEIISIFDNGISFNRMLVPYVIGAAIIMLFSLIMSNFIVPTTNKKLNAAGDLHKLSAHQELEEQLHLRGAVGQDGGHRLQFHLRGVRQQCPAVENFGTNN